MPNFQVLQGVPSFSSQLGSALGQGVGQGIGNSIGQYFANRQNRRALEGLKPFYMEAGLPEDQFEQFTASGLSPELAVNALKMGAANRAAQQKAFEETQQKQQIASKVQQVFNRQAELLNQGRLGAKWLPSAWSRQGAQDRAEFDALNKTLEGIAKDMVSKGQLSDERFKFILKNLPNSDEDDRKNIGRLKAVALELGLDEGALQQERDSHSFEKSSFASKKNALPQVDTSFEKMPSAAKAKEWGRGAVIEDDNGTEYISDGTTWKKRLK